MFLRGNERIESAIERFYENGCEETLRAVTEAIRQRMHEDGQLVFPILRDPDNPDSFAFRSLEAEAGKPWNAAFTSMEEADKGPESEKLAIFMDVMMKYSLQTEAEGIIINPFGKLFRLDNTLIRKIFDADGGVEYIVPDGPVTEEMLEDGSFLKRAAEICGRNRTQMNVIRLCRILRDSRVWIPCRAIMGKADEDALSEMAAEAEKNEGLDSLAGREFVNLERIRMVPDILQSGDDFFFPVFTAAEEMGEYGSRFSKVQKHFPEAAALARNSEKDVKGIVINAFSEPFVVPKDLFDLIAGMDSAFERKEQDGE